MTTQEIIIFDNKGEAGLHISFCDKDLFLTAIARGEQYDFQVSAELLMGLLAFYKEHCKNVDKNESK